MFHYFIECCRSQSSISKIKISWATSLAWSTTNKTCANQYYHAAVQSQEKTLQDQSVWKGPTKMFQLCSDNPRTRLWRRYRNQDIQGMLVIVKLTNIGGCWYFCLSCSSKTVHFFKKILTWFLVGIINLPKIRTISTEFVQNQEHV